jgi:hypothetical protein
MRAALLLTLLPILPGCAMTTASVGTNAVACSAFEPIRWSKKDTEETIRQVKEHNAAWAAVRFKASPRSLCGHVAGQ